MVPQIHKLKILPEYFIAVALGYKTFEIRKNDRDFKVNDVIFLQEWHPDIKDFTGRQVAGQITYITDYEQKEGFVVMSFKKV